VPCAFNTWDRGSARHGTPMRRWGDGLASS
jgi:hypothetical protein